jgi:hypothetical protein
MIFEPEVLAIVIGFMVLSNRLVAALITPIFDKYQVDKFWLMYVAWVMAGVLVFLADVNLFAEFIPNLLIGKILTAIVAGGGGNLLHDLTDQSDEIVFLAPEE